MQNALFKPILNGFAHLLSSAQASTHPKAKQFAEGLRLSIDRRDEPVLREHIGIATDTDICGASARPIASLLGQTLDDTIGWELWAELGRCTALVPTDIPEAALPAIRARMESMRGVIERFPHLSQGARDCMVAHAAIEVSVQAKDVAKVVEEPNFISNSAMCTRIGIIMTWRSTQYLYF